MDWFLVLFLFRCLWRLFGLGRLFLCLNFVVFFVGRMFLRIVVRFVEFGFWLLGGLLVFLFLLG